MGVVLNKIGEKKMEYEIITSVFEKEGNLTIVPNEDYPVIKEITFIAIGEVTYLQIDFDKYIMGHTSKRHPQYKEKFVGSGRFEGCGGEKDIKELNFHFWEEEKSLFRRTSIGKGQKQIGVTFKFKYDGLIIGHFINCFVEESPDDCPFFRGVLIPGNICVEKLGYEGP